MPTRVIGLDIGTTQVRAAEIEVSGKGVGAPGSASLLALASVPLRPGAMGDGEVFEPEVVTQALRQLWSKGGFSSKHVVVGIGNQRTVVRELDVPEMPMDQLRGSLQFHVAELLPMSTDEALLDFYPTAQVTTDTGASLRGILVAAPKSSVSQLIAPVEAAGLRPLGVDLNAFALLRAQVHGEWEHQTVALVDIGARTTNVIISAGGRPRLVRILTSGGQDATDALSNGVQIPVVEAEELKKHVGVAADVAPQFRPARDALGVATKALVDAVRNTFVYYQGNNPGAGIQHVVITGGASHLPGLGQYLASAIRLPVSFGDGTTRVAVNRKAQTAVRGQESLVATVIGLGLAEVAA